MFHEVQEAVVNFATSSDSFASQVAEDRRFENASTFIIILSR